MKLLLKVVATEQWVAKRQAEQALRRACQKGSEVMPHVYGNEIQPRRGDCEVRNDRCQ